MEGKNGNKNTALLACITALLSLNMLLVGWLYNGVTSRMDRLEAILEHVRERTIRIQKEVEP